MARYEVDGQVVRIADIDGDGKNEIIAGVYAREEGQDINIDTEGIAAFRYATVENNEFP